MKKKRFLGTTDILRDNHTLIVNIGTKTNVHIKT